MKAGVGSNVPARRMVPAGRAFIVMIVCFLLWLLVAATTLRRSAEASPFGARRTAALGALAPFSGLSRVLGLARLNSAVEVALGRPDPLAPIPSFPVVVPTKNPPGHGTTPLPPLRRGTRAHPIRVLVIGDSEALDLGYGLQRAAAPAGGRYKVFLDGRISTGLSRLDYFNWLGQARKDARRFKPDVVVVLLGLNDPQDFRAGGRYFVRFTKPWSNAYADRVAVMIQELGQNSRRVIWVGDPIVSNKNVAYGMRVLNRIYKSQTKGVPGVSYLDSWHLFVDRKGRYTAYLANSSGHLQQVREGDGEHLTAAGQDRLGQFVFDAIKALSATSPSSSPSPSASKSKSPSPPAPPGG